jgi:hypothetical protein
MGPFENPFNPNQIRNPYNANKIHTNEIATPQQFDCSVEASKLTLEAEATVAAATDLMLVVARMTAVTTVTATATLTVTAATKQMVS